MHFQLWAIMSCCLTAVLAADFCASGLCKGSHHIGCNNNNAFAPNCPSNARLVNMDPNINSILEWHNQKRNQIAGGQLSGYSPAVRMAEMQWNNDLAYLASLNVKKCIMQHDQCHNTQNFKMSGQNLGMIGYTGDENGSSDQKLIENNINSWWSEYKNAKMEYINKYPSGYSGPAIGHFTVMTAESNTHVGCAAARYKEGQWNRFLIGCNYATTNIIGRAMYASGNTASKCSTGRSGRYSSLCSTNEKYST